jgi:hypothetical protein
MKKTPTRVALAAAACAALAVPAVALAANPIKGGHYSNQKYPSFAMVSKTGKSAKIIVYPGKCDTGLALTATKPAKISGGKLTYNGPAGLPGTTKFNANIKVSGKFVTSHKLTWTLHLTSGSCTYTKTLTLTLMKS